MNFENDYQQCFDKILWSTAQLQIKIPKPLLFKITKLIVQTMTGRWRYFHSIEHILAVGGSTDAIEILAALFHDIVYVQVDGSVQFNLTQYLAPFIEEDREKLYVRKQTELPDDAMFDMVAAVFSCIPGSELSPFAGQNEFLSAVVAAKVLEPFFSPALIVQIAACIEATIPFRSKSESGLSPSDLLYQRLHLINHQFYLQLTDEEIVQTVKRSVRVSNRDVGGFAHPSSAVFLANTWSLMPETNHNLQKSGSYTVRDYRIAIQKMWGFMNFLKPELIFRQFQGEPDDQTYQDLVERAEINLEVSRLYLQSKLVANAILEALSLRLGQDVSLAIMMGELPDSGFALGRLGDSFPSLLNPYQPATDIEKEVWQLLAIGRCDTTNYDLKTSPLTAFVVEYIGFDGIQQLWQRSQEFFQGIIASEEFLTSCNTNMVRIIINEVANLLENRKIALCRSSKPLHTNFAYTQD